MSSTRRYTLFFLFLLFFLSCEDIIERDITGDEVVLKTPSAGYATSIQEQIFWWDEIVGATHYELMIVSPDILAPDILLLDTVIIKNQFTWELDTGRYEWCVKGLNSSYETENSCRLLEITN